MGFSFVFVEHFDMVKVTHLVIVPPEGVDDFVVIEDYGLTILKDDLVVVPVVWFVRCLLKEFR